MCHIRDGRGVNRPLVYRCHNALIFEHAIQICNRYVSRHIPSSFAVGVGCYRILGSGGSVDFYIELARRRPLYVLAGIIQQQ